MRIFVLFVVVVFSSNAIARDTSLSCTDVLVPDIVKFESDLAVGLSYLKTINQSNYSDKKKELNSVGNFFGYGALVRGSVDYNDFSRNLATITSETNFDLNVKESISYFAQTMPPIAFQTYTDCLRFNSAKDFGFHAYISHVHERFVSVTFFWNPSNPQDVDRETDIRVIFISGNEGDHNIPVNIPKSRYFSVGIERQSEEDFILHLSGDGEEPFTLEYPFEPDPILPCAYQSENDTVTFLPYFRRNAPKCSHCAPAPNVCVRIFPSNGGPRDTRTKPVTLDLACFKSGRQTAPTFVTNWDCSNALRGHVNSFDYQDGGESREVLLGETCQSLVEMGERIGVDMDLECLDATKSMSSMDSVDIPTVSFSIDDIKKLLSEVEN